MYVTFRYDRMNRIYYFFRGVNMEDQNENKINRHVKYAKEHLKRIPLDVQKEEYEKWKMAAGKQYETLSGYIKKAVRMRIDSENDNPRS